MLRKKYRTKGSEQMSPGQMLPGQMVLGQLKSVPDSPMNLCLKFRQNRVSNS